MSDKNKFEQFSSDIYENDDFGVEDFEEVKTDKKESTNPKEVKTEKKTEEDIIVDNTNNESELNLEDKSDDTLLDEINDEWDPFKLEGEQDIDLEQELNKEPIIKTNSFNKKKILILGWIWLGILLIVILIIFLFSGNDNSNTKKVIVTENKFASLNEVVEDEESIDETITTTESWSTENDNLWETIEKEVEEVVSLDDSTNHKINIPENSNDDVINITEAILAPSTVKVKMNTIGEFDWIEENTDEWTSFIKIKENSLVIPTVSKANFIPDVKIEVLNTQKQYSATDLIKIEFNVLLNSVLILRLSSHFDMIYFL